MNTEHKALFTLHNFQPCPEDIITECQLNPILKPVAYKPLGMGLSYVVATLKTDKYKYFLFEIGGPSAEDYEYNQRQMKVLREKDFITYDQLLKEL